MPLPLSFSVLFPKPQMKKKSSTYRSQRNNTDMNANTSNYPQNPPSTPNLKTSKNGIPVLVPVPENIKMCSHAPTSTTPSSHGIFNSNAINAICNNHTHSYPTQFSLAQQLAQAQLQAQAKAQAQAQAQAAKYYSTPLFRAPCRCGRNHSLGLIPCLDQNAYALLLGQNVWKPYWGGYGYGAAFGGGGVYGFGFGRGRG